jgi:uncharacterized protein (UPF0332 family)
MMEDELKTRPVHNLAKVTEQRYKEIEGFAKKVSDKHKGMISSTIIKRPELSRESIELMFIVDDLNSLVFDQHVAELKMSASEMAYASTLPLQCDAMLASDLWTGFKARDEIIFQILRESLVVKDNGFFLPLQDLLVKGKVRPSEESVKVYFVKAERSMKSADQHVSKAVIDLYWAVTDAAHAAVMVAGITPPSPDELAETLKRELIARNLVHRRCGEIVDRLFNTAKQIMHKQRFEISGKEFDSYLADADFLIKEMDDFVKEHVKDDVEGRVKEHRR